MMNYDLLRAGLPPVNPVDPQRIASRVSSSNRVLIVLDDDPTGTQSVTDLPVLTRWSVEDLEWALGTRASAVYVLTNSRSLDADAADQVNREIVTAAILASRNLGIRITFVSRSDSTLRGHFPLEPDVIIETIANLGGPPPSGIILVPAFPDAGRVTVNGVHYTKDRDEFIPVAESEFARDPTFGYSSSRLVDWVEEKCEARNSGGPVVEIFLSTLRSGSAAVAKQLRAAPHGATFVVDAVEEDDMRQLALGLDTLESEGREYVYRVGPPFVRCRIGQERSDPVESLGSGVQGSFKGGLIVVGSHVGLTTAQLSYLKKQRPRMRVVEIDVQSLLAHELAQPTIDQVSDAVITALPDEDVVVQTSRTLVRSESADKSLEISRAVSEALVRVVRRVLDRGSPRFVLAKGGITSSDVATRGLSVTRAWARGTLFRGIVSIWEPVVGPSIGIPYVVFAGNVGSDESLAEAVDKLSAS